MLIFYCFGTLQLRKFMFKLVVAVNPWHFFLFLFFLMRVPISFCVMVMIFCGRYSQVRNNSQNRIFLLHSCERIFESYLFRQEVSNNFFNTSLIEPKLFFIDIRFEDYFLHTLLIGLGLNKGTSGRMMIKLKN